MCTEANAMVSSTLFVLYLWKFVAEMQQSVSSALFLLLSNKEIKIAVNDVLGNEMHCFFYRKHDEEAILAVFLWPR